MEYNWKKVFTYQTLTKMITFEDLKFTTHSMGDGIHATMDLKNGNTISVIKTPYSYGGKVGLYELAVIDSNGKFLDVQGYLKETNVVDIINQLDK